MGSIQLTCILQKVQCHEEGEGREEVRLFQIKRGDITKYMHEP